MRIVIVGPGALGSLLTARFSLHFTEKEGKGAGNDNHLSLLDYKPARARQINEHGLILEENSRLKTCFPMVTTRPSICSDADVVFLCVKSTVVRAALDRIQPFLVADQLLVAMQNGVAHLRDIKNVPCCSGVGITSEGANLAAAGHVRHGGAGLTRVGLLGRPVPICAGLLERTAKLLNEAGLAAEITTDPMKHVWAKLFINVGINALTAINGCLNGELLDSERTREAMTRAVREAEEVARALHIDADEDPVAAVLRICENTGNNVSSMLQDVRNRRRTEIDAINGAVVEEGKRLGIPTPVNAELVRQIKEIEAGYS